MYVCVCLFLSLSLYIYLSPSAFPSLNGIRSSGAWAIQFLGSRMYALAISKRMSTAHAVGAWDGHRPLGQTQNVVSRLAPVLVTAKQTSRPQKTSL